MGLHLRRNFFRAALEALTDTNPKSFDVGEIFVLEALSTGESSLVIAVLEHWMKTNKVRHFLLIFFHHFLMKLLPQDKLSDLELIHNSVYFASHVSHKKLKESKALSLVESAIYCATVDRQTEILQVTSKGKSRNIFFRFCRCCCNGTRKRPMTSGRA